VLVFEKRKAEVDSKCNPEEEVYIFVALRFDKQKDNDHNNQYRSDC
jgi:hypothetical protein